LDLPVLTRNRAFAAAQVEQDFARAVALMDQAIAQQPADPRYYYERDQYAQAKGDPPAARIKPLDRAQAVVLTHVPALSAYTQLLVIEGRYEDALELMGKYEYRRWEGGYSIYPYWVHSHLALARQALAEEDLASARQHAEKATTFPENLQAAQSDWTAVAHWFWGQAWQQRGNRRKAEAHFELASQGEGRTPEQRYATALAMQALGEQDKARARFAALVEEGQAKLKAGEELDFFDPFASLSTPEAWQAEGHHLIALGRLGQGDEAAAQQHMQLARELEPVLLSLFLAE